MVDNSDESTERVKVNAVGSQGVLGMNRQAFHRLLAGVSFCLSFLSSPHPGNTGNRMATAWKPCHRSRPSNELRGKSVTKLKTLRNMV